jgi:hypothetical protein
MGFVNSGLSLKMMVSVISYTTGGIFLDERRDLWRRQRECKILPKSALFSPAIRLAKNANGAIFQVIKSPFYHKKLSFADNLKFHFFKHLLKFKTTTYGFRNWFIGFRMVVRIDLGAGCGALSTEGAPKSAVHFVFYGIMGKVFVLRHACLFGVVHDRRVVQTNGTRRG